MQLDHTLHSSLNIESFSIQLTLSRSSSKAEYRALRATTCEFPWLMYFLKDLHVECSKLHVIYCDNENALHIITNPLFHETKAPKD